MSVTNDAFAALAAEVQQEELDRAQKKGKSDFVYESVKWTGLTDGVPKIIRAVGIPNEAPQSHLTPHTARTIRYAKIIDDRKKEIRVVLPSRETDSAHLLWRIIDKVSEVEWIDKKKYFIQERENNSIFEMVCKNSKPKGSDQNKYDKGWAGKEMFIFNCIDRTPAMYEWSRENKHSVLLSKSVTVSKQADGSVREYAETGVPAYGFANIIALNLFKHYKDWINYDLGIEKTGLMENPYRIVNASKYFEEFSEDIQKLIVKGPLTEEEMSWEKYDLDKLFGVTSYTKLYNKLNKSITMIDFALKTHFSEELKSLADEEAKLHKENHPDVVDSTSPAVTPVATPPIKEEVPEVTTRGAKVAEKVLESPIGYFRLSEKNKADITSMKHIKGNHWEMVYSTEEKIIPCNVCRTEAPMDFLVCPGCNADF